MGKAHERLNDMPPEVVLYGGTGQAKVVRPIVEHWGARVVAVFDDTPGLASPFADVPIFRGYDSFTAWLKGRDVSRIGFSITIGNPHGRVRLRFHDRWVADGLRPVTAIHPTAFLEEDVTIGEGSQVMAGAIVLTEARIGRQCIVNTKASIDHESVLEDGCEVAPGGTLCGNVHMQTNAWVCAGATVLPRIVIGEDAVVGAGALVNRDVPSGAKVVGVPARLLRRP